MKKAELHQRLRRQYIEETGKTEVTTAEVAAFAVKRGWLKLPEPTDPLTRLADEIATSWRQETRHDNVTGRPYRVNHAVVEKEGGKNRTLWGDIDEAPRAFVQKAFVQRRQQIVGDCYHLSLDCDHYNSTHPTEEPIQLPLDFTEDVDERKSVDELDDDQAA